MNSHELHHQSVAKAQAKLLKWLQSPSTDAQKEKHHSNTMRNKSYKAKMPALGLSQLKQVIQLDLSKKRIVVEPGMTMEELVDATLTFGLIPAVLPEFKGITVGGAINGSALESSSHLHGQFNDICLSYEVLVGDGKVIHVSAEKFPELFYGMVGSYGTLGFLLSVEIQLVPTTGWMALNFRHFPSIRESIAFLSQLHKLPKPPETMEAIIFNAQKTMVMWGEEITSEQTQNMPKKHFSSYRDNWYYSTCDQIGNSQVAIPLRDYLFRHDRGAFWMAGYGLNLSILLNYGLHKIGLERKGPLTHCLPKNPGAISRSLFGWLADSQKLYASLHGGSEAWFEKHFVIQDFYLPEKNTFAFVEEALNRFKITPIWLCPIKSTTTPQFFSPHQRAHSELLFDVGIYGLPAQTYGPTAVRELEQLAHRLDGRKMFYAHTYIPEEEFWSLYPKQRYQDLRKKLVLEAFPDITQKVL